MAIKFENEVCEHLSLPSIPKKEWNGVTSFDKGVAVLAHKATDERSYAVCAFDAEKDNEPRIIKVFANTPFNGIEQVFVVPNYMGTDVEDTDLDDESKKKARELIAEANELTQQGEDETQQMLDKVASKNPYYFPQITNEDEAVAFLRTYNKTNRIKGVVPSNIETIKLRLAAIYADEQKKLKHNNKK